MSLGSEDSGSTSKSKHIMDQKKKKWAIYGPKKTSQLWAEIDIGFREYLKCQKKGGAIYEPKKRSQLLAEMSMGFREYLKCQKKGG
jgi:hypothetical protein